MALAAYKWKISRCHINVAVFNGDFIQCFCGHCCNRRMIYFCWSCDSCPLFSSLLTRQYQGNNVSWKLQQFNGYLRSNICDYLSGLAFFKSHVLWVEQRLWSHCTECGYSKGRALAPVVPKIAAIRTTIRYYKGVTAAAWTDFTWHLVQTDLRLALD